MRIAAFLLSLILTIGLIYCLDREWGKTPPLGRLLSPQHGFWQNAEPLNKDFNQKIALPGLKAKGEVYFDESLIPHVEAASEEDACYIQGYLHARFRLWQMEFQTYAAAGRLSEVLGPGENNTYLKLDRSMRRLGMIDAAEKSLEEILKDSTTRKDCDAYTAGVNDYIGTLKEGDLPLEYKLLNYKPEPWNNLKIVLFVKYMSLDLAGGDEDFELTNAKALFSKEIFAKLYPAVQDSLDPIVPKGSVFLPQQKHPVVPARVDSLYFNNHDTVTVREFKPEKSNGSNNWAVSGAKTLSGKPILCNDPHLSTNLPSIWYQMQIRTPEYNVYGVSFPGAPFVIIGFNDSCSWGITNAGRDVRDYYEIKFKDGDKKEYWFDSAWRPADHRIDTIRIKGTRDFYDTVAYTVFGPVMFEPSYTGSSTAPNSKYYAVHWAPARPSNELKTFSLFQKMTGYEGYKEGLSHFCTPGLSFVFASKDGKIAIYQQGRFPAKWKGQGMFVMPGQDSSFMWQDDISTEENPGMLDPARGFVSSANQEPTDTTYPYFLGSDFPIYRGLIINRRLSQMDSITPRMMETLQTDNYDVFAEMAKPVLLRNLDESRLDGVAKAYLNTFKLWNLRNDAGEKGPIIFKLWWNHLQEGLFDDEFSSIKLPILRPYESTVLEALIKDSTYPFIDNINTPEKETLNQIVTAAFLKCIPDLKTIGSEDRMAWAKYKDTWARHLLRLPQLSRTHLDIGGGVHCINAAKQFHGPSWRMVVQMSEKTEAYGIYPGGQSGNPGSRYYDNFVNKWAAGEYDPLWVMDKNESKDARVKWVMHFTPAAR